MDINDYNASYDAYVESYEKMNPRRYPLQKNPTRVDVTVHHNESVFSEGYIIIKD